MNTFNLKRAWLAVLVSIFATTGAAAVPFTLPEIATYNGNSSMYTPTSGLMAGVGGSPGTFLDLGIIGAAGTYSFDTDGSQNLSSGFDLDTEMGLWDGAGLLLDADDDGLGFPYSLITADLVDGEYFIGISEFDSIFGDGFTNTGTGFEDGEIGDTFLNIDGAFAGSVLAGGAGTGLDQTAFYRFEIGSIGLVSEPSILLLMGLGLVGMGVARRRL